MSFFYDDPSLAEDRPLFEGLFEAQLPLPIQPRPLVETIVKRDGRVELYDARQIVHAIREAARSIGDSVDSADSYARAVTLYLSKSHPARKVSVDDVHDAIERVLDAMRRGAVATAYARQFRRMAVSDQAAVSDATEPLSSFTHEVLFGADASEPGAGLAANDKLAGVLKSAYAAERVFSEGVMLAHRAGVIHVHGLESIDRFESIHLALEAEVFGAAAEVCGEETSGAFGASAFPNRNSGTRSTEAEVFGAAASGAFGASAFPDRNSGTRSTEAEVFGAAAGGAFGASAFPNRNSGTSQGAGTRGMSGAALTERLCAVDEFADRVIRSRSIAENVECYWRAQGQIAVDGADALGAFFIRRLARAGQAIGGIRIHLTENLGGFQSVCDAIGVGDEDAEVGPFQISADVLPRLLADRGSEFLGGIGDALRAMGSVTLRLRREEPLSLYDALGEETRPIIGGRVTLNLARAAAENRNPVLLFERLEALAQLAREAHSDRLRFLRQLKHGAARDVAPMAFVLGFVGLDDCVRRITGEGMHESESAMTLGEEILARLRDACAATPVSDMVSMWLAPTHEREVAARLYDCDYGHGESTGFAYAAGADFGGWGTRALEYARLQGRFHPLLDYGADCVLNVTAESDDERQLTELVRRVFLETPCVTVTLVRRSSVGAPRRAT